MISSFNLARAARIFVLAVMCGGAHTAFADATIGGACSGGAQSALSTDGNNAVCVSGTWQYPYYTARSAAAAAGSSCAGITAGSVRYNTTLASMEFCDGTTWISPYNVQSSVAVATPAGSGYFVMSYGTWDANLGGLAGANAKCLTDLTTHTGWRDYATANARGLLVASKVHAFVCVNPGGCGGPLASTTYYFADANNAAAGGGSFTTDSSAVGPNDATSWGAANYFGGNYKYWTGRSSAGGGTNTTWATSAGVTCTNFSTNSSASTGQYGASAQTDARRWTTSSYTCDTVLHLICVVDP